MYLLASHPWISTDVQLLIFEFYYIKYVHFLNQPLKFCQRAQYLFEKFLFMLQFPLCFGLLLHGKGLNQKSKTWEPPLLVVVTGETQTAMVNAGISASRRPLLIFVFHFYLIED